MTMDGDFDCLVEAVRRVRASDACKALVIKLKGSRLYERSARQFVQLVVDVLPRRTVHALALEVHANLFLQDVGNFLRTGAVREPSEEKTFGPPYTVTPATVSLLYAVFVNYVDFKVHEHRRGNWVKIADIDR